MTDPKIVSAYKRAIAKATAHACIAYSNGDGTYEVPSTSTPGTMYTVYPVGHAWHALACTCPGAAHPACVHRAVVAWCVKYHVSAKRPEAQESPVQDTAIYHETLAALISMSARDSAQQQADADALNTAASFRPLHLVAS